MSQEVPQNVERRVHHSGEKVLEFDGVEITLGGRTILHDITFHVVRGEFLCLLGPNGAGKSTLLKAILGLLTPSAGTISVLGGPPTHDTSKIGYVPQRKDFDRSFPATTIEMIVANLRGQWPVRIKPDEREKAMAVLARVRGEKLANSPLWALSGGESQRAFIARALVTEPEIIMFDEPAAGVDQRGRGELYELLNEIAADDYLSALMVTHSITAISKTAEKVVIVDGNVQAFALPEELFGNGTLMSLIGGHGPDATE